LTASAVSPSTCTGTHPSEAAAVRSRRAAVVLAIALGLLYAGLVAIGAVLHSDMIDMDGVVYVRYAQYIARGDFGSSVSGSWNPVISWSIAPFIRLGMDGLYAGRVALAIWGLAVLAGFSFLMRRFVPLAPGWRAAVLALVVLNTVHWSIGRINADTILAAVLLTYFGLVLGPGLLTSRRAPLLAGMAGGAAYLCKYYALPFFVVHFPMTLLLTAVIRPNQDTGDAAPSFRRQARRLLSSWMIGLCGFGAVAAPWIATISKKYDRLLFTTHARALAHAEQGKRRWIDGLWTPIPPHLTFCEVRETMKGEYVSLAGAPRHFLREKAAVVTANGRVLYEMFRSFDQIGLSFAAMLLLLPAAFLMRANRAELFRLLWLAGTVLLYGSGYLLSHVEARFFEPFMFPLFLLLSVQIALLLPRVIGRKAGGAVSKERQRIAVALAILVLVSFGTNRALLLCTDLRAGNPTGYRQLAARLKHSGFAGPLASNSWVDGLYVAFHMDTPFLGRPHLATPERWGDELRQGGVRTFLVFKSDLIPRDFLERSGWSCQAVMDMSVPLDKVFVFVPGPPQTAAVSDRAASEAPGSQP